MYNFLKAKKNKEEKCHGGKGYVMFSRVMNKNLFESKIDYIDYTIIPEGSSIGLHKHGYEEEIYFILEGTAEMSNGNKKFKVTKGDIIKNDIGESHELINIGKKPVKILVIQVSV